MGLGMFVRRSGEEAFSKLTGDCGWNRTAAADDVTEAKPCHVILSRMSATMMLT
jgi:hypothetical protein